MIYDKRLGKLNDRQKEILFKTNELHKNAVGNDYKDGISIVKVWLEKGVVCVRLKMKNGITIPIPILGIKNPGERRVS